MTHIDLTIGDIKQHLARLSLPLVLGIMSIVFVSLVDAYFIGQLGEKELASIGYALPIINLWDSFAIGLGMGVAALVSQTVGAKKYPLLRKIVLTTLILAIIMGFCSFLIAYLIMTPLFLGLGANQDIIPTITDYMIPMFLAAGLVYPGLMGNAIIRGLGNSIIPAFVLIVGTVVNAIADPILIFGWGPIPSYGIAGAGYATVLARLSTLIMVVYFLSAKFNLLKKCSSWVSDFKKFSKPILFIGIPAAIANIITPFGISLLTRFVSNYGDLPIAGYGIAQRFELLCYIPFFALAGSMATFTGQNWGAQNKERIRDALKIGAQWSFIWGISIAVTLTLGGSFLGSLFTDNPEIIKTTALYLSIGPWGYFALGLIQITAAKLNATKHPQYAILIPIVEFFVLILPISLIGEHFFGLKGLFLGVPIGLIISGCGAYFFTQKILR